MSKKSVWKSTTEFSEKVQHMLERFEMATGMGLHNLTISHVRDDAVFIRVYGMLNAYGIARFANLVDDVYIEIDAVAPQFFDIRLFGSDWMKEHEVRRNRKFLEMGEFASELPSQVKVYADA